ncbi:DNA-entry nuclease [Lactobacillus johnsonii]|uniref:sunset domain-containing protein n=1 Tax=Lactobacillus johnsonii TaxID=33959 RepID=UPI00107EA793|nr:DNA-entry nuclease [Lactobacillus johnsonii]TGA94759.1 DNA-entry nuclease [Lactobacillus johnsonii]
MMKNNIVKIIMWILFWFYLIPYYLLKKFVFKKNKHQVFWANCVTIALLVLLSLALSPSSTTTTSINENASAKSSRVVHKTVIKKVGTKELNKEKARAKVLKQEQKNKQAEYDKLKQQLDDYQEKEEQQKQEAEEQQRATQHQEANTSSSSNSSDSSNQGDLYTGNQGTIVGNSNSKIYHVPGQAGYHMNSANAVYFNSEQDAINAGYRKAKR